LSLGEKTNNFTGGDLFGSHANGRTRMANIDGDATHDPQKRIQHRFAIKFLIDDVANWAWTCELQYDCIHPGNVIGQEKKSAAGQVFQPVRRDTVKAVQQRHDNDMQHALSGGHGTHCLSFTINTWPSAIANWR
jgi:hypothetical protein